MQKQKSTPPPPEPTGSGGILSRKLKPVPQTENLNKLADKRKVAKERAVQRRVKMRKICFCKHRGCGIGDFIEVTEEEYMSYPY